MKGVEVWRGAWLTRGGKENLVAKLNDGGDWDVVGCLLEVLRVDENIIDEHYHKFIQLWFAHTVYKVHEHSRYPERSVFLFNKQDRSSTGRTNLYGAWAIGAALGTNLIWNSTWRTEVVSSVIGEMLSLEARDMESNLLSAPDSNNTLTRCTDLHNVLSLHRHDKLPILVVDCSQWCISYTWDSFQYTYYSQLVAIVIAVVLVIVDTIIGIFVVVVEVLSIIKLAFVITGDSLGLVFLLRLSVLAMVAACDSSAMVTLLATNFLMAS
uniref:Uncharacterized protein n=1 Tax=Tanacetum cinerariifolium TaxID=118510 RepID=A0A6L2JGU5_TANCI|nr:hypothetical protein [Tanacetum cinerariifolium]